MAALTYEGAMQIAEFIHAYVRPDWDVKGIVRALGLAKDRGTAAQVAVAALVAAQNADNRTPGVIPLTGPHWATSGRQAPRPTPASRSHTCSTCYLPEEECRRRWAYDHDFISVPDAKRRAIEAAEGVPNYVRAAHQRQQHMVVKGRPVDNVELP